MSKLAHLHDVVMALCLSPMAGTARKKRTDDGETARGSAIVQKRGAAFPREPLKLRGTQRSFHSPCIYMSKEKPIVGGSGAEWNINKHRAPFRIKRSSTEPRVQTNKKAARQTAKQARNNHTAPLITAALQEIYTLIEKL